MEDKFTDNELYSEIFITMAMFCEEIVRINNDQ